MESLFSNLFPDTDKTAWLAQVQNELKHDNAYESLRWQTDEGFALDPYYTVDSLRDLPLIAIQAVQKPTAGWINAPEYSISEGKADNSLLRDALNQGADALILNLATPNINLSQLLNGIKLSDTPVFFRLNADQPGFINALKRVAPYQLKGGLLMAMGDVAIEATRLTADSPQFRTVCASGHVFHNAGGTVTQELAFTLASLADVYDALTEAGLPIDQLIPKTTLSISVGTSYFLEIAKLRALRVLFNHFINHYPSSISNTYTVPYPFIHCQTSTFYDAAVAPYTNLLRATTEAMATVVGGCDALTVHPYDTVLNQSGISTTNAKLSERIARNVSLLLKQESYLDKVADPSAGSYYIEQLTGHLVETAWTRFLDVEKRGGLAKALSTGFIQQELENAYQKKVEAVRNGKVLVGVTKFRTDDVGTTNQQSQLTVSSLPDRRLAEEFE